MTDEIKEFHNKELQKRAVLQNRDLSIQMVIDDIYAVSNGNLVGSEGE